MSSRQKPTSVSLNDAAKGLAQQMIWWGHDVRHPEGNALQRFGLHKAASTGLTGTSCYSSNWRGGKIELHGAVASWTGPVAVPGCLFDRDKKRIFLWNEAVPPIPGRQTGETAGSEEIWRSLGPLISWVVAYEQWVLDVLGVEWRTGCWKAVKRLPRGRRWLPPDKALVWWQTAITSVPPRPKELLKPSLS